MLYLIKCCLYCLAYYNYHHKIGCVWTGAAARGAFAGAGFPRRHHAPCRSIRSSAAGPRVDVFRCGPLWQGFGPMLSRVVFCSRGLGPIAPGSPLRGVRTSFPRRTYARTRGVRDPPRVRQMCLSPLWNFTSSMYFLMFCSSARGQTSSTSSVSTTMYSFSPLMTAILSLGSETMLLRVS